MNFLGGGKEERAEKRRPQIFQGRDVFAEFTHRQSTDRPTDRSMDELSFHRHFTRETRQTQRHDLVLRFRRRSAQLDSRAMQSSSRFFDKWRLIMRERGEGGCVLKRIRKHDYSWLYLSELAEPARCDRTRGSYPRAMERRDLLRFRAARAAGSDVSFFELRRLEP